MLDVGTKADDYAISKLFNYMQVNPTCGGCCGEIEVELTEDMDFGSFFVGAA